MIDYEKIYTNHKCKICGRFCKNRRSLGNHLTRSHNKLKMREYILEHFLEGKIPLCACGCGKEVNWHKLHYRFNTYVNGHNDTGFDISTYKPTPEQIKKRTEAICKAYDEKGEEIKAKISKAVNEAWKDPEKVQNNSEGKKARWRDPEYLQRMTKIRKQVWQEQHDELVKKIFTPEFGQKMSAANRRRNFNRKSKEEDNFIEYLKSIFEKVVVSYWINKGDVHKCYDAYLPEYNLLIEFDGVYWHALDREENFTKDQILGMSNDMLKNKLAVYRGADLVRIRSDTRYERIKTIDDLRFHAYHNQLADGTIVKCGVFRFKNDEQLLLNRDYLLKADKDFLKKTILPLLVRFFQEYVEANGWFYPQSDERLKSVLVDIRRLSKMIDEWTISSTGSVGTSFLKSRFKSYWDVMDGPVEATKDPKKIERVLAYRLGLNNSKMYEYTMFDGSKVQAHETFDINLKNVRRGLVVQRNAVSFFKPTAAFSVFCRFLKNKQNPVVWDPSGGFGARLLAFAAYAQDGGKYIGTEPACSTYNDLCGLAEELRTESQIISELYNCGSERQIPVDNKTVDLVFTSPPYFDKEKYFDEPTQCWIRYPSQGQWVVGYLIPTFEQARRVLKDDGVMVININEENKNIIVEAAESAGFSLCDELSLSTGVDHFGRAKKRKNRTEPILVFKIM